MKRTNKIPRKKTTGNKSDARKSSEHFRETERDRDSGHAKKSRKFPSATSRRFNPDESRGKSEKIRGAGYSDQRQRPKSGSQGKNFDKRNAPGIRNTAKKYGRNKLAEKRDTHSQSPVPKGDQTMRLNKYLANSGVAARRKCDELIAAGHVKVNDTVITEMGYRVKQGDRVYFKNKLVEPVHFVYILLNKPKDYITTAEDERGRSTVLELVQRATEERVYPVGRLDRNTTGLLLLTNDGDLAQKLSHPRYGAPKLYEVELDKPLSFQDLRAIENGIELEDGIATVDGIAYAHPINKRILGIALHIGKNRIVRRIFEHLGYKVVKLDRTMYAGLTKKDLPRGKWRFLSEREIIRLKHLKP